MQLLANGSDVRANLLILFWKWRLFPVPSKPKKAKLAKDIKTEEKKGIHDEEKELKDGKVSLPDQFRRIRRWVSLLLRRLPHVLEMRVSVIRIHIGTEDPSKTAILYGAISQALAFFLEWIDGRVLIVRERRESVITVVPDFLSNQTTWQIKLEFRVRFGSLPRLVLTLLLPYFHNKTKSKKILKKTTQETRKKTCPKPAIS